MHVCVCVHERERKRENKRETKIDRERGRERGEGREREKVRAKVFASVTPCELHKSSTFSEMHTSSGLYIKTCAIFGFQNASKLDRRRPCNRAHTHTLSLSLSLSHSHTHTYTHIPSSLFLLRTNSLDDALAHPYT